ncbi:MAG: hypothetical protein R3D66_01225 [Alphaproteobacteria bacterium]|nr:hypothetical protein [Alphaproteobacteria bacterium]
MTRTMPQHPDFNLTAYDSLLKTAQDNGYRFESFKCLHEASIPDEAHICLLRHDIDVDMEAALRMAKLEHARGVRATYFFMLRSPVYNLTARANNDFARQITALGHDVGLHYDQAYHPGDQRSEAEWMAFEAAFLEGLLDVEISTISFHQPSPAVLEGRIETGRFLNTYTDPASKGFHYISDSNRQWAKESAEDAFAAKRYKRLQLLIHPLWWVYGECMTTEHVWDKAIATNIGRMQRQILDTERAYGPARNILFQSSGTRKEDAA